MNTSLENLLTVMNTTLANAGDESDSSGDDQAKTVGKIVAGVVVIAFVAATAVSCSYLANPRHRNSIFGSNSDDDHEYRALASSSNNSI